ncbi:hypothetical protein AA12467_1994 [Gluconobacter sphaericus NBRC 12467]|nr:hypothetical protein AA12467_1994 [Gluconobacter sphaericus NBRC 12467]
MNNIKKSFSSEVRNIFSSNNIPQSVRSLKKWVPGSDIGLALSVSALLSILILPLPTFVLGHVDKRSIRSS